MHILVTGGAGYIGGHTCIELINSGHDVVVVDNYSNSMPEVLNRINEITGKSLEFYECDLLDMEKLDLVFDEYKIDAVIHFAGFKSVTESIALPLLYYHNNITGTINLCRSMVKNGVKNIVFSSSAVVYGQGYKMPLKEDLPVGGCINPYGQTKFMIEQILKDLYVSDNSWDITILRYFNPIGAHESGIMGENPKGIPTNIMPVITRVANGNQPVFMIYGNDYDTPDGTAIRDYIHVVDLARGHVKALEKQKTRNGLQVYNLGTGKGSSVLELLSVFENVNGIKLPVMYAPRRDGDIPVSYASVDKAISELNFVAEYDLKKMCEDAWRWQVMNPNGYN